MWFLYALSSALFASVRRTNEKRISQNLNHFTIGWTVQGLSLPIITLAMLALHQGINPLHLRISFWLATAVIWFGFYPLNTYCYVNAYRHGELSRILPLQSLGPVFALGTGWVAFRQRPSLMAVLAIGSIVISVYTLNMKGWRMHNPLAMFTADKANLFMLGSVVLATLAAMFDTIAIRASNPLFYCFVSTLGAVPILFLSARITGVRERIAIRQHVRGLGIAGVFFGLSYATYVSAIANGPLAYVSAVRGSSIFLGVVIGVIWFKESITKQKLVSFIAMAVGLTFLAISSA
jgi:uncharacterized membrane protein